MEFRILGSLQVCDGDREITVSGHKQRGLIALLLLHANQVVSEEVLIEALWGEEASEKAGRNLHVLVSRLRASIGADRVVREAGGYVLRVEEGELDVDQFERLRHEHRTADALALWRGPALADFAYEDWAQNETRRLEELRLVALEERIEFDLASGDHTEVVGELQTLVAEHPLRETLRCLLIVALYRCGRQAEALEAYHDARRMLDEELGLEPSPALRELEGAVLRQDPELDAPSRVRALVPLRKGRRRGALAAAAAVLFGFAGAASAVILVQRDYGERRAAAAVPQDSATTDAPARARRTPTKAPRKVVRARRTTAAPNASRANTTVMPSTSPPASRAKAPPPPPAALPAAVPAAKSKPATTERTRTTAPTTPKPPPPPPVNQTRIEDDFNDGVINRTIWQRSTSSGVTVEEVNGRLEITIAPTAVAGGDYNIISGTLGTTCRYQGDFDVRVDFELLEWPAGSGVNTNLASWYSAYSATIGRFSSNLGREEYAGWFPGTANSLATTHSAGTLRIVREGTQTIAHYRSGGRWQSVVSARVSGAPIIGLSVYSRDDWFADKPVRIAFDNFVLLTDQPVC